MCCCEDNQGHFAKEILGKRWWVNIQLNMFVTSKYNHCWRWLFSASKPLSLKPFTLLWTQTPIQNMCVTNTYNYCSTIRLKSLKNPSLWWTVLRRLIPLLHTKHKLNNKGCLLAPEPHDWSYCALGGVARLAVTSKILLLGHGLGKNWQYLQNNNWKGLSNIKYRPDFSFHGYAWEDFIQPKSACWLLWNTLHPPTRQFCQIRASRLIKWHSVYRACTPTPGQNHLDGACSFPIIFSRKYWNPV